METIVSTQYLYPQAVISNGLVTGNEWTNPDHILVVDGLYAQSSVSGTSDIIVGNFSFNIPQDAVVTGFGFQFDGYAASVTSPLTTLSFDLVDASSGTNVYYPYGQVFSGLTTLPAIYSFGGENYSFGQSLTPDQVNNIRLQVTSSGNAFCDAVVMQAFYYVPSGSTPVPLPPTAVPGYQSQLQALPFALSRPLGATDTSMYLESFTYPNGNTIQVADIVGGYLQLTVDPDLASESNATGFAENVQAAQWELTNSGTEMKVDFSTLSNRGLDFKYPFGTNSFNITDHAKGATVIITANAPFLEQFVKKTELLTPTILPQLAVPYATAAMLPGSPSYDNGTAGVGATLTATSNAALAVDGQSPSAGKAVLVKNQTVTSIQQPLVQSSAQSFIGHVTSGIAPKPTGLAVGDLFLVYVHYVNSGQTLTTPSGYTLLNSTSNVAGTYTIATLYKIAASGDVSGSGPTITFSAATYARVCSVRVTNFDPASIFGTPATANQSGVFVFTSSASVTPSLSNSLVMFSYGEQGSVNSGMGNSTDTVFGTPEGTVTSVQNWVDSTPGLSSGTVVYDGRVTTASTNGFTVSPGSNFADWAGTLVVVNPVASAPSAASQYNGVYVVTSPGSVSTPYVLTRSPNYDSPIEINYSGPVAVLYGTANANTGWLLDTQVATVGTDPLVYGQYVFPSAGTVTSVSGTANRITVASPTTTPVIDISATFEALLGKVASPLSQFAATTSAQLAGIVSDETGSGSLVFATSPTLVTPNLGTPSAVNLTNGVSLPIASGISGLGTGIATFLATPTSANLASAITNETGTGSLVFGSKPTFIGTVQTIVPVAALAIDGSLGTIFTKTISGTSTLTQSNLSPGQNFNVIVTGAFTVTWFSGITWLTPGGIVPTQAAVTSYGFTCTASNAFIGYLMGTQ